jgi:hypothetical protein
MPDSPTALYHLKINGKPLASNTEFTSEQKNLVILKCEIAMEGTATSHILPNDNFISNYEHASILHYPLVLKEKA